MNKKNSLAAVLISGVMTCICAPAAHADDDDAGLAALGFLLGNALGGPAVVYSEPRVVVAPRAPSYRYYAPPAAYYAPPPVYYAPPPPRAYVYHSYGRRDWHRGDDDDD